MDLGTHLRDKHWNLFLWDLELFRFSFKHAHTKLENMHFCWLSWNFVLKVDLGTHLRDKIWHLFLWDLDLFWPSYKVGQTKVENMHFFEFLGIEFWNLIWLPISEISIETYFYEIQIYFGPPSRLIKPRLKICTFVDFPKFKFWK